MHGSMWSLGSHEHQQVKELRWKKAGNSPPIDLTLSACSTGAVVSFDFLVPPVYSVDIPACWVRTGRPLMLID